MFGLQLGQPQDGDNDHDREWMPQELEVQLGMWLLRRFPLLSQLTVHTEPVPWGHA